MQFTHDNDIDEDESKTYQVKFRGTSSKYELVSYDCESDGMSYLYCMDLIHNTTGEKMPVFKWSCFDEYFVLIDAPTGKYLELEDFKSDYECDYDTMYEFDRMYESTVINEPVKLKLVTRSDKIVEFLSSLKQMRMID